VYTLIMCLFIACLLPVLSKIPLAIAMKNQPEGYDNNHPRAQQAALTGFGARAAGGHQNSFESLIIYSAAVLTALATQHTTETIQWLAIAYLIIRCVYHVLYLANWATLRSIVWGISFLISMSILWLCLDI
jgi:uncharacterized MAPEG superfamily protein